MRKILVLSLTVGAFCSLSLQRACAADFSKKIPGGASFGEVLGIWGEPTEKVDKNVKKEVVWYYPDGARVVFKDGKVRSSQSTKTIRATLEQQEASKAALATTTGAELSGETRDLVRDIAKEVPSGPDSPGMDSSVGNIGQPPPLIPNQLPPGGKGAPPGIAPGEVVDDSDD